MPEVLVAYLMFIACLMFLVLFTYKLYRKTHQEIKQRRADDWAKAEELEEEAPEIAKILK